MKSPIDSRARFVETTAQLLQRQGYHATGLKQIIAESGAPRGSLYFHFPGGKLELATEALRTSGETMRELLTLIVESAPTPADAIRAVMAALAAQLEASEFQQGCPMATVALEAAGLEPELRQVCSGAYREWVKLIEARLLQDGVPAQRVESLANLVLSTVEGALLLARVHGDTGPVISAGEELARLYESVLDGAQT
jgi:TetR/AcrR family transcriptional repressor of lmrAB and yxaGH operons